MGTRRASSDAGEISSWLIVAAALAAAAVLAGGVLSGTISQLSARVAEAAGVSAGAGASGGGPGGGADPGSAGGGDSGASTGEGDNAGSAGGEDPGGTVLTQTEIDELNGLIAITPVDDPRSNAADRLEDRINQLIDDPEVAAEVFRLALTGMPIEWAIAEATGDYSGIDGPIELADYTDDDKVTILRWLGYEDPESLVDGADDLFSMLPPWLLSDLLHDGWSFEVALNLGEAVAPGTWVLPVGGSASIEGSATVSLTNPQIGIGFGQTQEIEITARAIAQVEGSIGKNKLQKIYKYLSRFDAVPAGMQRIIDQNPILRRALKGVPFSVAYSEFYGVELAYEATLTTAQVDAIQNGTGGLPDVFDPGSFEPGNSVLIRGGEIQGSNFEARYKLLQINDSTTAFDGIGFGVTALEDGRIAVYSGPIEAVERQTRIGLPFLFSVGATNTYTDYELSYAEIDLSTPEGRAAYDNFITGGGVPTADTGSVATATTEISAYDYELGLNIGFGPIEATATGNGEQWNTTVTTWADGRQESTFDVGYGDSMVQVAAPHGANGEPDFGQTSLTIVLADLDAGDTSVTSAVFNGATVDSMVNIEGRHNAQITFDAADLLQLRDLARVGVRQHTDGDAHYEAVLITPHGFNQQIAAAETVDEVASIIMQTPRHDRTELVVGLTQISTLAVDYDNPDVFGADLPGDIVLQPTQ